MSSSALSPQRLTEIPQELRDAAAEIKKDTIEAYMSRIRDAVSSVEGVKSNVKQTADIGDVVPMIHALNGYRCSRRTTSSRGARRPS